MDQRKEATQDPKTAAPEPRQEETKLRRFRIVKLEERIAPLSSGGGGGGYSDCYSIPTLFTCSR